MACHLTLAPAGRTREPVALPPDELLPVVAWNAEAGVFIVRDPVQITCAAAAANDDRPLRPPPRAARLSQARARAAELFPRDADALMRGLACALALWAGAGVLGWTWG